MIKGLRIAAVYCAQRRMDYLQSSVRSVYSSVERILIGTSAAMGFDRQALDQVQTHPELASKIEITSGSWTTPQQCTSDLARLLAEQGMSHVLFMDPQDVYGETELQRILSFVADHPDAGQFHARVHNYWKSPLYRIEPLDPVERLIVSKITRTAVVTIPEEVGTCHSFTFASSTTDVIDRLRHQGLGTQSIQQWRKQVWEAWNQKRQLRNLHPERAERFRNARRIHASTLPKSLARHPFLSAEIVGEGSQKKPVCSLIFVANESGSKIRDFIDRLAATVPDDCEIIGCASAPETISILESTPGIHVIPMSPGDDVRSAWFQAGAVATAENLVFLTTHVEFEGDWVEGFIAAFESPQPRTVYLPRIQDRATGKDPKLIFEKRRGSNYGRQTTTNASFDLNSTVCWGCTKQTLRELQEPRDGDGPVSLVQLEDTLVFGSGKEGVEEAHQHQSHAAIRASIVVPIYNNLHFTKACIDSILQNTPIGTYELIVVDNGSTDGSREYLETITQYVRLIHNRRNLFFAGGCNRGAWAARGENIVFLNNDTLVTPGWLEGLLRPIEQDERVAIVGNKQLLPESHPTCASRVWHAGMVIGDDRLPWHVYYGFDSDHPFVNRERDCVSVSGCCLIIRRNVFEELGGFDPYFQNGFEDVDLCLRAGELGHRIVYTPHSEIVHFVSRTESRFDRETVNLQKFKQRWADKLVPNEAECYRDAGLLAESTNDSMRVGFISAFNQKCAAADYAKALLARYSPNSYIVLSEFGIRDRRAGQDPPHVIRCWDRAGTWYYPLLRWITALRLNPIHVNFDHNLHPAAFLEVLAALKNAGKRVVVTFHDTASVPALVADICSLADAVIVSTAPNRLELILAGCDPSKIHVISPGAGALTEHSAREIRGRLSILPSKRIIVSTGDITPQKGILETIDAIGELRKELDVDYFILGNAASDQPETVDYFQRCKAAARRLHLDRHVRFIEGLSEEETAQYIAIADAVVLFHQTKRCGWSDDAATALSAGRPVITSSDSSFIAFGDAVLRAGDGIPLVQALRSVLTNPFLAHELSNRASAFSRDHSWDIAAESHRDVYHRVLAASGIPAPALLNRYRAYTAQGYPPEKADTLYRVLIPRLQGTVIEFCSRSLDLTRWIQPQVSVTSSAECAALASLPGIDLPVVTVQGFTNSRFVEARFDTVVLHIPAQADACVAMVLAFLPHLSNDQRLLVLFDESEAQSTKVAEQFCASVSPRFVVERMRLDGSHVLIEIRPSPTREIKEPTHPPVSRLPAPARVCWEGPQLVNHSLALVNREMELALLESKQIELTILPVGADNFAHALAERARTLTAHYGKALTGPIDIHVRHQWPPNWIPPARGHWVVIQPWEHGALPEEWVAHVNRHVDEVWAPSTFVRELYVDSGVDASRVYVVPNGVDTEFFRPGVKPYRLPSARSFKFLFVGGTIHRKGIDVLLKAYRQAFKPEDDVALVIKDVGSAGIYRGQGMGEIIAGMEADPECPDIIYLDRDLTDSEMAGLYNACDCLVHPYRGEGFGLPVLEAMACGRAVVVTAGGATDDFVDDSTGFRVPARKEVFGSRVISDLKTAGDLWMLEPDVDALAATLLQVFKDRDNTRKVGLRARHKVEDGWSWKHTAAKLNERIEALVKRPTFRNLRSYEAAILIDANDESMVAAAGQVVASLERNSYANLKILVRANGPSADVDKLRGEYPELEILEGFSFDAALQYIREHFLAPFLVLVTEPLRFSKQWLKQLADAAAAIGTDAKILTPSIDLDDCGHYVFQDCGEDDHSFQKFSRTLWRNHRGTYQEISTVARGCAVLSWACLFMSDGDSLSHWQGWLSSLRQQGLRTYWAQDTCVGLLPQFRGLVPAASGHDCS